VTRLKLLLLPLTLRLVFVLAEDEIEAEAALLIRNAIMLFMLLLMLLDDDDDDDDDDDAAVVTATIETAITHHCRNAKLIVLGDDNGDDDCRRLERRGIAYGAQQSEV